MPLATLSDRYQRSWLTHEERISVSSGTLVQRTAGAMYLALRLLKSLSLICSAMSSFPSSQSSPKEAVVRIRQDSGALSCGAFLQRYDAP